MGIREKRVGEIVSYTATTLSLIVAGWLAVKGINQPETYTSSMSINHHRAYGSVNLSCRECHVPPDSPVALSGDLISCISCHKDIEPGIAYEDALEIRRGSFGYLPDFEYRTKRAVEMHNMTRGMSCTDCHKEHQSYGKPYPEGWNEESWKAENSHLLANLENEHPSIKVSMSENIDTEMFTDWTQKF